MKNRKKLMVFFSLISIFLFSCQALTSTPSIIPSEIPPKPTATPVVEIIPTEQPITAVPQATGEAIILRSKPDQDILVEIYEISNPGVVAIQVLTDSGNGLGSGFVIDEEGHIITNFHVIEGVSELEVDFPSGLKIRGEVIGTDTDSDLAVIKVEASPEEIFPLP